MDFTDFPIECLGETVVKAHREYLADLAEKHLPFPTTLEGTQIYRDAAMVYLLAWINNRMANSVKSTTAQIIRHSAEVVDISSDDEFADSEDEEGARRVVMSAVICFSM